MVTRVTHYNKYSGILRDLTCAGTLYVVSTLTEKIKNETLEKIKGSPNNQEIKRK